MDFVATPFQHGSEAEGRPLVLAGPTMVETAEQIDAVARRLRGTGVDYLAAAVWPPGGEPDDSASAGARGLAWLTDAARRHGLRTATAVKSRLEVDLALAQGIDMLWLAGETVAAVPAMKEVAQALRGAAASVLVENPPHPEIEPWIEALERLAAGGARAVGAMHSGFPASGAAESREAIGWETVIEIRRRLPELPIVAAANRLAQRRDRVRELAQAALDFGCDGLFLEVHSDPDHAWRSPDLQLTPERALAILAEVSPRRRSTQEAEFNQGLAALRSEIDELDRRLLELLASRMEVVDRIASSKRSQNLASLQVERWRAMVEERSRWAAALDLAPELARAVFAAVHGESVRRQIARSSGAPSRSENEPPQEES